MNTGGEGCAVAAVVIGLDAVRAASASGIEMDGDEGRVAVRIRDRDPRRKRNKDITVARHNHAVPARDKRAPKSPRDVERQIFFAYPLAGHTAAIEATVTRIEHKSARLRVELRRS